MQVEVLGSYGADGNLDNDTLKNNLNNINGITGVPDRIEDTSFPLMVTVEGVNIQITKEGEVSDASFVYAQDGLLLWYDGILNTRSGNNPNATSLEDLSGNNNDGIFYNMNTDSGYYSSDEKGYVFLHNNSYIKSTNKIGISGDANFTIETVSNMWEDGKIPNYSPYTSSCAAWWGSSSATVGTSCIFGYSRSSSKLSVGFINNTACSDENYDLIGKTSYMSFRKTKVGQIKKGNTDIEKINYNGQDIPNTYTGTATFTTNMVDSEVTVGRAWQWGGQNRTFYGSIQSVRIYNRVLTDEKIQHNYEIDRKRFGIL